MSSDQTSVTARADAGAPVRQPTRYDLDRRMAHVEAEQGAILSKVADLSRSVVAQGDTLNNIASMVSRLDAGKDRLPLGTLISLGTFILLIGGVVGALVITPLQAQVADNRIQHRIASETTIPSLQSRLDTDRQRIAAAEKQLDILGQMTREYLPWIGKTTEMVERHDIQLQSRRSDGEDAQDARLDRLERLVDRLVNIEARTSSDD